MTDEMKKVPSSMLTLKGLEAKMRPIIDEIEKEIGGIQLAIIFAIPDPDDTDLYACSGYINMDLPLLTTAIQKELNKPLDRPVSIS